MPQDLGSAIGGVIDRLEQLHNGMVETGDGMRHFHGTYVRAAQALSDEISAGRFGDPAWVEQFGVRVAELYLRALDQRTVDGRPPAPWQIAFAAADDSRLPPLRQVLLAVNVHVNYDMPRALLGAIPDDDFLRPDVLALRAADHGRVDSMLVRFAATDHRERLDGERSSKDRLRTPLYRLATQRFLLESRRKVWRNVHLLAGARRRGDEPLRRALDSLEDLCAARVADLAAPGIVILRQALSGLTVTLPRQPVATDRNA
jgi:hypothetical protein